MLKQIRKGKGLGNGLERIKIKKMAEITTKKVLDNLK